MFPHCGKNPYASVRFFEQPSPLHQLVNFAAHGLPGNVRGRRQRKRIAQLQLLIHGGFLCICLLKRREWSGWAIKSVYIVMSNLPQHDDHGKIAIKFMVNHVEITQEKMAHPQCHLALMLLVLFQCEWVLGDFYFLFGIGTHGRKTNAAGECFNSLLV